MCAYWTLICLQTRCLLQLLLKNEMVFRIFFQKNLLYWLSTSISGLFWKECKILLIYILCFINIIPRYVNLFSKTTCVKEFLSKYVRNLCWYKFSNFFVPTGHFKSFIKCNVSIHSIYFTIFLYAEAQLILQICVISNINLFIAIKWLNCLKISR